MRAEVAALLKGLQLVDLELPARPSPIRVGEFLRGDRTPHERKSRASTEALEGAAEAIVGARLPSCTGGKR